MHTQGLFIVYHVSLWRSEKIWQRNTLMEIEFHSSEYQNQWTVACQILLSVGFPGKNTRVGSHSLLQGIFLTQSMGSQRVRHDRAICTNHYDNLLEFNLYLN